ncbi:MAG: phosphoribosylamine--glycine ligase, partial [Syntrophaceae bacterium]|nr:phosphoribosylamine--glycine ligase [Syntrophaceae bacterium]
MIRVLLIGNGAREHVIAETVKRSRHGTALFSYMTVNNPGIASLSDDVLAGSYGDREGIVRFAKERKIDFAIIGPEDPLSKGVVDALQKEGIPSVGPTQSLARLETSKSFTRNLLEKYGIPGNPR